jgi:hypothetical protein
LGHWQAAIDDIKETEMRKQDLRSPVIPNSKIGTPESFAIKVVNNS